MKELANRLIQWIQDEVMRAGGRGVVVGLSGGLDSSVVAVLAKRAFPDSVLSVFLPCDSDPTDEEHALLVARQFNIPVQKIALDGVYECLRQTLPQQGLPLERQKQAEANLKPRLRMVAIYYLANRLGYLVLGTGNRCELTVGYFSKYGDGGVDLLPLGNLVKGQVRELACYLGIPQVIIDKPPTAGLWPGQTDEGEMGLSYDELDLYLTKGEARQEVKKKVEAMRAASAHKRAPPPTPPL